MIADLINDKLKIRLITKNVMSVYSTNKEYTDSFIRTLRNSSYLVDGNELSSNEIIQRVPKDYNIYESVADYAQHHCSYDDFAEYLTYLSLEFILWLKFNQLDNDQLNIVESLLSLTSSKPIVITNYIESSEYSQKMYSLLMNLGLSKNKLIIVPFTDIRSAVNNSTCQCYVKSPDAAKIELRFPESFLNTEFKTKIKYYTGKHPFTYHQDSYIIKPSCFKYSLLDMLMITFYRLKILFITLMNWMRSV